jgi:hypothetical protein
MKSKLYIATVAVFVLLIGAGQALSDCVFNGKQVPEGKRVGPLVCENGKWVEKP